MNPAKRDVVNIAAPPTKGPPPFTPRRAIIAPAVAFLLTAAALTPMLFPGARVDAMVAEAKERFLLECDYAHEADAQQQFGQLYAGHPTLIVPEVHRAWCGPRVLATTWIDGSTFERFLERPPSQDDRDRIGESLFEFYIGTLFRIRFGLMSILSRLGARANWYRLERAFAESP